MDFNLILKNMFEELLNYFNEECFKNIKINNKNVSIGNDFLLENLTTKNIDSIDLIIDELNLLRQENQNILTKEDADHKFFASTEILLSSAYEGFRKIKESFINLNFLKHSESGRELIDLNEKFVVRKLTSSSQRILNKYENLPNRFVNNNKVKEFLDCLKKMMSCETVNDLVLLSNELLNKQDEIKKLDYFIDYNALIDEYGWVHDIVKLSNANAEFMGLIVDVEIFSNVIKQQLFKENRVRA
ncbi:hypothetical protein [Spiroplasma diminutum]|uniref:Uncharacterized protein n=1 Tax=Spiroplasma diminutum CUAS-1 TaxID=1276221 RepID=S5MF55_9MOLU|nr:hypothetical protein [Spiroplasma diminutum]AGR42423.1 hypothetical protein SDIMI_v3c07190 [Spiroplasma diminutum CUAS-1]